MDKNHIGKHWIGTLAAAAVVAILPWMTTPASGQEKGGGKNGKPSAPKGLPTPRTADGHPDFSGVYHAPGYGPGDPKSKTGETFSRNIARDLNAEDVPLQPWAKELLAKRSGDIRKDDPEGFCLPGGTPRINPYPWKVVQTDKLFLILYEGNVHSYRQVFLDGRKHDPDVIDTWWGDSIGHWEGNTMVVDTVGLNDKAWLDADGHPRTQKAHIIERFTRPELGRVVIEITIDDPGAYTKPWKVTEVAQLAPGWEIAENICNENQDENGNNLDVKHLVGK
jgi:hypothetical protein